MPEGQCLVFVECAGQPYDDVSARRIGAVGRYVFVPIEKALLESYGVGRLSASGKLAADAASGVFEERISAFAAVAVDEAAVVGRATTGISASMQVRSPRRALSLGVGALFERNDGKRACVGASGARFGAVAGLERRDGGAVEKRARRTIGPRSGNEGGAVGAHEVGDIGPYNLLPRNELEGAQDGIGEKRSALYDCGFPKGIETVEPDNLEQGVVDDGVGYAGCDVMRGCADLLCMPYARRHEDGALGSEIDRCGRLKRELRKRVGRAAQGVGAPLNERPAARRAGFVEHRLRNRAVFDPERFHVLPPDVEHEIGFWAEAARGLQMGRGFDDARIDAERCHEEAFAVSRYGRVPDRAERRAVVFAGHGPVEVEQHLGSSGEHVSRDRLVVGVEQATIFVDEREFDGCRACIDAEVHRPLGIAEALARCLVRGMTLLESLVFRIA